MNGQHARILARGGNIAVVHLDSRAFPGVLVQGDTFAELQRQLADAAARLRGNPDDVEALSDLEYGINELAQVLRFYEATLADFGIRLPYSSSAD
jgi:hypothetical protein